jgi:hypothetical protein
MLTDPYLIALRACSNRTYLQTRLPAPSYASSVYSTTSTLHDHDEEQRHSEPVMHEKLKHEDGFDDLDLPQLQGWPLVVAVFAYAINFVWKSLSLTCILGSVLDWFLQRSILLS